MSDIDAVITWVDGSQPAHRQRLGEHLAATGLHGVAAAHATRFHDAGELDYCLASIRRHAPWLRNIFIVTDGQVPAALQRLAGTPWAERIRLVDHSALFAGFEHYLPTFNSRSIISLLWRIPGLSERFVYFNDDFMLLRPVQETDFFRGQALVLRGRWRLQSSLGLGWRKSASSSVEAGARAAQEIAARLAGHRLRYLRLNHAPYVMRRSLLECFFARYPQLLESNIRHRLRSPAQFKTESLVAHLALAEGCALIDRSLRVTHLDPGCRGEADLSLRMQQADARSEQAFGCVQSLDQATQTLRSSIFAWLARRIGVEGAPAS